MAYVDNVPSRWPGHRLYAGGRQLSGTVTNRMYQRRTLVGGFLGQDDVPDIAPGFLPVGTRLQYAAEYKGDVAVGGVAPEDAVGILGTALPQWNIAVEQGHGHRDFVGQSHIALNLRLLGDYGQSDDVRANVDHELYNMGVERIFGSRIVSYTVPGHGQTDTGAEPPTTKVPSPGHADALQWLMDNALWLGLGVGALVIVPKLIGRR